MARQSEENSPGRPEERDAVPNGAGAGGTLLAVPGGAGGTLLAVPGGAGGTLLAVPGAVPPVPGGAGGTLLAVPGAVPPVPGGAGGTLLAVPGGAGGTLLAVPGGAGGTLLAVPGAVPPVPGGAGGTLLAVPGGAGGTLLAVPGAVPPVPGGAGGTLLAVPGAVPPVPGGAGGTLLAVPGAVPPVPGGAGGTLLAVPGGAGGTLLAVPGAVPPVPGGAGGTLLAVPGGAGGTLLAVPGGAGGTLLAVPGAVPPVPGGAGGTLLAVPGGAGGTLLAVPGAVPPVPGGAGGTLLAVPGAVPPVPGGAGGTLLAVPGGAGGTLLAVPGAVPPVPGGAGGTLLAVPGAVPPVPGGAGGTLLAVPGAVPPVPGGAWGTLLAVPGAVASFSPAWRQTLAAAGAVLLTFSAGLTSGYSAVLLPQLRAHPRPIPYDTDTASWIAAMAALPMGPGCLLSGWMMERFGRRNSHYAACALCLLGWALVAGAAGLPHMLAGRFLTGACVGLLGPLGPVYIAETAEPRLRGFFLAGVSLAIALGIFAAHLLGTFVSWRWTAAVCCLFPVLSAALLAMVPESPTWLISKGRTEDGATAFYWLRGYGDAAKRELRSLMENKKAADSEPIRTWREKLATVGSPEFMKPLLIMIVFFVTCQFSGVNAVAFYSIEIVEKAVGSGVDHHLAMLAIDGVRVAASLAACAACRRGGRRPLCLGSGAGAAAAMLALAGCLRWRAPGAAAALLPLACLLVYMTAVSLGLVPLPWIMCGEVFPVRVRGLGSGISSAVTFLSFFVVVKTAPGTMAALGEEATFLMYGTVALLGTLVLYFILPETRGKSLQEIEDGFTGKTAQLEA